jgi:hypothetical protein
VGKRTLPVFAIGKNIQAKSKLMQKLQQARSGKRWQALGRLQSSRTPNFQGQHGRQSNSRTSFGTSGPHSPFRALKLEISGFGLNHNKHTPQLLVYKLGLGWDFSRTSSNLMTVHRGLSVPDIVSLVFDQIDDDKTTLARLARCCREFHNLSLDRLWRDLPSVFPLWDLLPPLMDGKIVTEVLSNFSC